MHFANCGREEGEDSGPLAYRSRKPMSCTERLSKVSVHPTSHYYADAGQMVILKLHTDGKKIDLRFGRYVRQHEMQLWRSTIGCGKGYPKEGISKEVAVQHPLFLHINDDLRKSRQQESFLLRGTIKKTNKATREKECPLRLSVRSCLSQDP